MIPLSVIIPFYNSANYLKRTTASLLNQTLDNIEYIFIDDGSTDDSKNTILDVLSSFPHKKPQVVISSSSPDGRNCGIAQARQAGLHLAHGDYVTFCDSDDWIDENYYSDLYAAAIAEDVDMVVGDHCVETNENCRRIIAPDINNWCDFKRFPHWFHLFLCNRLIKVSLIKDNNISFYKNINFSEDYGFVIKAYYYSQKNYHVKSSALYHYNKTNDNSLTTDLSLSSQLQRIECIRLLDSFFKSMNECLDNCSVHNMEKYSAKDALLTVDKFSIWKKTFPEIAHMVIKDPNRNLRYKIVYLAGQYLSWRILWAYHYLSKRIMQHN